MVTQLALWVGLSLVIETEAEMEAEYYSCLFCLCLVLLCHMAPQLGGGGLSTYVCVDVYVCWLGVGVHSCAPVAVVWHIYAYWMAMVT